MKLDSTCPDSESLVVHQLRGLVAEVLGTSGFLREIQYGQSGTRDQREVHVTHQEVEQHSEC